jgi:hypothetical protein
MNIWFYMAGAYVLVSITIWIVARFSPREWREPELCEECLLQKYSILSDDGASVSPGGGSSGIGSENDDSLSNDDKLIDEVIESVNDPCLSHEHAAGRTLEILENGFTIGNSFWFAIGSLMQQGSDLNPKV